MKHYDITVHYNNSKYLFSFSTLMSVCSINFWFSSLIFLIDCRQKKNGTMLRHKFSFMIQLIKNWKSLNSTSEYIDLMDVNPIQTRGTFENSVGRRCLKLVEAIFIMNSKTYLRNTSHNYLVLWLTFRPPFPCTIFRFVRKRYVSSSLDWSKTLSLR